MTDEQRLQEITDMLLLVRDNLFKGMSKSIQKLQARSINEMLDIPNFIKNIPEPKKLAELSDEEIDRVIKANMTITDSRLYDAIFGIALDIEKALKEKAA